MDCEYCDSPGGEKTLKNQVCMPINGRVQCIDYCIHHVVAALNAGGIHTIASCCGHGSDMPGRIDLADGRVLIIVRDAATRCGSLVSSERTHSIVTKVIEDEKN